MFDIFIGSIKKNSKQLNVNITSSAKPQRHHYKIKFKEYSEETTYSQKYKHCNKFCLKNKTKNFYKNG